MSRLLSLPIFVLVLILFSCTSAKYPSNNQLRSRKNGIDIVAWNEDTIHVIQLNLNSDNVFNYTIVNRETGNYSKQSYQGHYINTGDTLYFNYKRKRKPTGFEDYVIWEITGNYLIQPLKNERKRIFLRRPSKFQR